jgi:hypothetical protein
MKIGQEGFARGHRDQVSVVLGNTFEDDAKELVALSWVVLAFPEESEVGQGSRSLTHIHDLRRLKAREFLL